MEKSETKENTYFYLLSKAKEIQQVWCSAPLLHVAPTPYNLSRTTQVQERPRSIHHHHLQILNIANCSSPRYAQRVPQTWYKPPVPSTPPQNHTLGSSMQAYMLILMDNDQIFL